MGMGDSERGEVKAEDKREDMCSKKGGLARLNLERGGSSSEGRL